MSLIIITSIRKTIFTQYNCSLFLMIKNCNLCRSAEIYPVKLSFKEKVKCQFQLIKAYEMPVHQDRLHTCAQMCHITTNWAQQYKLVRWFSFFFIIFSMQICFRYGLSTVVKTQLKWMGCGKLPPVLQEKSKREKVRLLLGVWEATVQLFA